MQKSSTILQVENLSKQYRLGTIGTGTLGDDLTRWWYQIRGKEDPFLKVGAVNDRAAIANEDYVWALRDINFEVKQGEVLGIIGKNGAGKSTLLKILSKVTSPTTGSIKTRGRIASLLEVGTGFHGELTGRENIFMNGAVLGMTRREIKDKLDEIISFSGCEKYIDTPVKRYSSGMTVRLAFAVAAHLEPEILVIDEVLAVGDAEFQKKAIGKMQNLSKDEGRTVLFVSHNMVSIQQLCTKCIVLQDGLLKFSGTPLESINYYLENQKIAFDEIKFPLETEKISVECFRLLNFEGNNVNSLILGLPFEIVVGLKNFHQKIEFNLRFQIIDDKQNIITTINSYHSNASFLADPLKNVIFRCEISKLRINPGNYILAIQILDLLSMEVLYEEPTFFKFHIVPGDFYKTGKIPKQENMGIFCNEQNWKIST